MAKPNAYMKIYWGDLLKDTPHLDAEGFGSYVLLLGAYWCRGGPLPDDDQFLRNVARCPTEHWMRMKGRLAEFFHVEAGLWKHKRVEKELAAAEEEYRLQCERTKSATEARQRNVERNDQRNVDVTSTVTKDVTTIVTITQSESESESESKSESKSESELDKADKASGSTKPTKLSARQREAARQAEGALKGEWVNDAGKWVNRIKRDAGKVERVMNEVCDAIKAGRIAGTPAAYAEDCWKRFT